MVQPRSPWYSRYRRKKPTLVDPSPRADYAGGRHVESTEAAYQYLLGSLRTNAPGYADQNFFEMARAYTGSVYLAINTLVTQCGQATYKLYEEDPDEPDSKTPLSHYEDASQLIHEPNPDDTFQEILEQTALQYNLTGTAALWVPHDVDDPDDVPREMYVLSTASLLPQPISPDYPNGAYLVQPWYPAGPYAMIPTTQGVGAVVPAEQIIRIKKPHPFFRWIGYSTLYAISTQIDAARMIDVTRMNHMQRGFDPAAVITFDPSVSRPDDAALRRLEAQIQAVWQGPQNAGRVVVAPAGAEVNTWGHTPSEMAYESGWTQLLDFGLSVFSVNRGVAGMTEGLTYATLFASLRWFYLFSLGPLLSKISQKLTRHLLHPFFDRAFTLEIQGKEITDDELVQKQLGTLIQGKAIRVGEMRKAMNKLGFPIILEESDRDKEWAGDQEGKGGPSGPGGAAGGGQNPLAALLGGQGQKQPGDSAEEQGDEDGNAMQRKRPKNPQGQGALGPRGPAPEREQKSLHDRNEQMMSAIERHLSNGTIKQHKE